METSGQLKQMRTYIWRDFILKRPFQKGRGIGAIDCSDHKIYKHLKSQAEKASLLTKRNKQG